MKLKRLKELINAIPDDNIEIFVVTDDYSYSFDITKVRLAEDMKSVDFVVDMDI